jgi:hypothetical protein
MSAGDGRRQWSTAEAVAREAQYPFTLLIFLVWLSLSFLLLLVLLLQAAFQQFFRHYLVQVVIVCMVKDQWL